VKVGEHRDVEMEDVDGTAAGEDGDEDADADLDGEPMVDDDDNDVLMGTDEDLDGEPMLDSSDEEASKQQEQLTTDESTAGKDDSSQAVDSKTDDAANKGKQILPKKRQRPKAVDMFADDSDED
jgi:hypothetical protein